MPGDVGRLHVWRKLDAREFKFERVRHRADEHGLAQTGDTFEQGVPSGENADQDAADNVLLPDDHTLDFALNRLNGLAELFQICGCWGGRHHPSFEFSTIYR